MNIKGIITPTITPMYEDERINIKSLEEQVERLIESGIHGIFPLGTNGEAYALSLEEKTSVIEATISKVNNRIPVYVGTGCITTKETVKLSKKAEELGADALSIISPFFAQASQEELYHHYKEVAEAVDIPIVLYNIPVRTGNKLAPETVKKLSEIANIAGIKDSSGDFLNILSYLEIKKKRPDFVVLAGNDSLILSTLIAGGDGAVAGCSNSYPKTMAEIYDYFIENDIEKSKERQDKITKYRGLFKYGNSNTVIKETVSMMGYEVGKCRSPFNIISKEGLNSIKDFLDNNSDMEWKEQ